MTVDYATNGCSDDVKVSLNFHQFALTMLLIPVFTMMLVPVHSFSSNRLDTTAKQMEKIAVTQGPISFRLHLFQGPAPETASCGGRVRS